MFVVVDGHGAAVGFEDVDALFKKFVARVEDLALFIFWVIAVFTNDENAIDG